MAQFILYNGDFFLEKEKLFDQQYLVNKLFSEEIRSIKSIMPFWKEHLQLLIFKFNLRNIGLPTFLQNEGNELKRQIERSLTKNKLFKSAVVSITIFHNQNKISYLISVVGSDSNKFLLNKDGLIVEIYDKVTKAISPLSSLSEGSEPFWKLLRSHQKQQPGIEFLLTNTEGSIIESWKKNIFIIKDKQIITPAISTGAYVDISLRIVKRISKNLGLDFIEVNQVLRSDLISAHEFFLCNCVKGIEWVKGFENKRYFSKTTRLINEEFNRQLIQ